MDTPSRSNDRYGRVADHLDPGTKWQGGQHTRRFNDAANPGNTPGPGGGAGKAGGGKDGAAAPPAAPAPKPRGPKP